MLERAKTRFMAIVDGSVRDVKETTLKMRIAGLLRVAQQCINEKQEPGSESFVNLHASARKLIADHVEKWPEDAERLAMDMEAVDELYMLAYPKKQMHPIVVGIICICIGCVGLLFVGGIFAIVHAGYVHVSHWLHTL
jgi:hypothetical protein